jgi:hypothetical protein
MKLTTEQSYAMLEKFGVFAREACDKCGQILGTVRYTRMGQLGEWCSRQCRDGKEAHTPGTCLTCKASLAVCAAVQNSARTLAGNAKIESLRLPKFRVTSN